MQVFVPKEELSLDVIKQYRVVNPRSIILILDYWQQLPGACLRLMSPADATSAHIFAPGHAWVLWPAVIHHPPSGSPAIATQALLDHLLVVVCLFGWCQTQHFPAAQMQAHQPLRPELGCRRAPSPWTRPRC